MVVVLGVARLAPGAPGQSEVAATQTLSPYFVIENGDPELDQLPVKRTAAEVTITGVIAHVTLTQTYANAGERPINATYVFPASTRAAVHGMRMTIGPHVITAQIRERQRAQREFEEARRAGRSASLLQQHRPNVFSMDVANLMPKDEIEIELRYSELLVPTDGTYSFVFPTVVGPRYSDEPAAIAPETDRWIQSPYLPEGRPTPMSLDLTVAIAVGLPLQELACPSHEIETEWLGEQAARVSLAPTETGGGNRDFILQYRLAGRQIESGLLLYEGQDESFFLIMAQPPARVQPEDLPPREYVFVMDVSGSMNGFPLDISRELLRSLIDSLQPTDSFNVICFAGASLALAPRSVPASAENIASTLALIDGQRGGGGTELLQAMEDAYAMPHDDGVARILILATDGYVGAERDVFRLIRGNLGNASVFAFGIGSSVNRHLIEGVARAGQGEPFIVTEPDAASGAAQRFREYVSSPVLTDLTLTCRGFDAYDIEPESLPDVLASRPVVVIGKYRGPAAGSITLRGTSGAGEHFTTFDLTRVAPQAEHQALRYLWARTRVATLSDQGLGEDEDETAREITSLGLTYELLTRYTSFVAVHEVVRNTAGATDVQQPLPLPQGVSNLAVGQPQPGASLPEPGLLLLLVVLGVGLGGACLRRHGRARDGGPP
jgi:Ca-activated chloride channel family protein